MKDELGETIMTKFAASRPKTYSYLIDDGNIYKRGKVKKKYVIERMLKLYHYRDYIFNTKPVLQLQQRFKSETHKVYTKEINKIALSNNDDKRMKTFENITSYPYGTSAGNVCKTKLLSEI